jgi:hypothetical protein
MAALMGVIALTLVVVGPAVLTGHPVLILIGVALGATVLIVTRRRRSWMPAGRR